MLALLGAFIAGVLTTLAPCVLPMLPVIVGGSLNGSGSDRKRAYVITASLGVSVAVFTLALKATTALIDIPATTWAYLSGTLLILLGVVSLFPGLWSGCPRACRCRHARPPDWPMPVSAAVSPGRS